MSLTTNPTQIIQQFLQSYASDGQAETFNSDGFNGLSVGVVVDTDDPLQQGRVRIFCPVLNDDPKSINVLPWAAYVSPFSGAIDNSSFFRGAGKTPGTTEGAVHYGFWATPELGASVLVGCIDGDFRRRFYLGCFSSPQEIHTMMHGRWQWDNGRLIGPLSSSGSEINPWAENIKRAFSDRSDSAEFKSRIADYQLSAVFQQPSRKKANYVDQTRQEMSDNELDEWVKELVGRNGYDWTGFRNIGAMLASKVYGLTTPGFHALSLDDRPYNCRIRIRSATGHQILMDDTNERIYVMTAEGNSWIEMDNNGNVDLFCDRRFSVHANKDINFTSEETIRMNAKNGIYLTAGDFGTGLSDTLDFEPETGEVRIHSQADTHIKSNKNIRTFAGESYYREVIKDVMEITYGSEFKEVTNDINVTTLRGDYSSNIARDNNEIIGRNSKRFTRKNSAVSAEGEIEFFSFGDSVNIGSNKGTTIRSANGDVALEASGSASGSGNVQIKTPRSQMSVGDDGLSGMSNGPVRIKSSSEVDMEVSPSIPNVSTPPSLNMPPANVPDGDAVNPPSLPQVDASRTLTLDEAVEVAYSAGFRGDDLVMAVAIMQGESSLNPAASNDLDANDKWGPAVGLFQIRALNNPEAYTGLDGLRDNSRGQLADPLYNAQVAYRVFKEQSPRGVWTVNKWEVLKYPDRIQRFRANAEQAVNRFYQMNGGGTFAAPSPLMGFGAASLMRIGLGDIKLSAPSDVLLQSITRSSGLNTITNKIDSISLTLNTSMNAISLLGTAVSALGGSISLPSLTDILPLPNIPFPLDLSSLDVLDLPKFSDLTDSIFRNVSSITSPIPGVDDIFGNLNSEIGSIVDGLSLGSVDPFSPNFAENITDRIASNLNNSIQRGLPLNISDAIIRNVNRQLPGLTTDIPEVQSLLQQKVRNVISDKMGGI